MNFLVWTVLNKTLYKPLGRFSTLMAATLLIGGLSILVLDLGRPDRLIVAMTSYNFKSIFTYKKPSLINSYCRYSDMI